MNSPTARLDEALPCPFCGAEIPSDEFPVNVNEGIGDEHGGEATPFYEVGCRSCNFGIGARLESEALAAWNRRAPAVPEKPQEAVAWYVGVAKHPEDFGRFPRPEKPDMARGVWSFDGPTWICDCTDFQTANDMVEGHNRQLLSAASLPLDAGRPPAVPEKPQEAVARWLLRNATIGLNEDGDGLYAWFNIKSDDEHEPAFLRICEPSGDDGEVTAEDAPFLTDEQRADINGTVPNAKGCVDDVDTIIAAIRYVADLPAHPISPALVGDEADAELQRQEAEAANGSLDRIADILGVDRHERRIVLIEAVRRLAERPAPRLAKVEAALERLWATVQAHVEDEGQSIPSTDGSTYSAQGDYDLLLAALLGPAGVPANEPMGLPKGESEQRNAVCDALTEAIVWIGNEADEAGESFTLDLRKERHVGTDDGSMTVRGLARLLTTCDPEGRDGDLGENTQRLWQKIARALSGAVPPHGAGETRSGLSGVNAQNIAIPPSEEGPQ